MFGWVDTPDNNLPAPLSLELFATAMVLADKVKPSLGDMMFAEGLNKRLGTTGSCCLRCCY